MTQQHRFTVTDNNGTEWGNGATEAEAWLEALNSIGYRSMSMASDLILEPVSELDYAVADLTCQEAQTMSNQQQQELTTETFKDPISGVHYGDAIKNGQGLYWQEKGGWTADDLNARLWTSGKGLRRAVAMIATTGTFTGSPFI
jgi:hypothetical protein